MTPDNPILFALNATREFGSAVAGRLDIALSPHEEREFEDGEHKTRPLTSVRNKGVFVIQSLYTDSEQSVNDKLCRLLFFIGALRDASAAKITAVVPYLAYARKDAKTQPRDPVTTRYVAALFESVGVDRVMTLDVHNLAAFQNAFRCRSDHLDTTALFARHFHDALRNEKDIAVVSPDVGGVKRAERLRQAIGKFQKKEPPLAFMEKTRGKGALKGGRLVGNVDGCAAIIVDDLISTGNTLAYAARACRVAGARRVMAAAGHGLFVGNANQALATDDLEKIVITDSVPPFRIMSGPVSPKMTVLSVSALFADSIKRVHEGGSLVELLEV